MGPFLAQQLHPHLLPLFLHYSLAYQTKQVETPTKLALLHLTLKLSSSLGGLDTPSPQLTYIFAADIRCHSCYKVPVLGCVDRQSCRLEPGQKCLTTNVYLGKMWIYSNLRCGTQQEPCREEFNQTEKKLGLNYNTTCCDKDNCNSPAPRPTPALALIFLTSLAGLGLWLLH